MQSRRFVTFGIGIVAIVSVAILLARLSPRSSGKMIESEPMLLTGTALSIRVPVGWDASDRSSCRQPCIRMRLPRNADGGQSMWPVITLEEVSRENLASSLDEYENDLDGSIDIHRIRIGGQPALEFASSGEVIVDTLESFTQGVSAVLPIESRHFVFAPDRVLYDCNIVGSASDIVEYSDVFDFFCASVNVRDWE